MYGSDKKESTKKEPPSYIDEDEENTDQNEEMDDEGI